MKIETNEHGTIVLKNVFNPIKLVTEKGETLIVCMRDSGFELCYENDFYEAKGGELKPYKKAEKELTKKWVRYRFRSDNCYDWRPVINDGLYPYWCTGHGGNGSGEYVTLVAYLPHWEHLGDHWPEAQLVESEARSEIVYTDRFPRPEWLKD